MDANPLANGKPAWSVLQKLLTANGLATFVPQTTQVQPSALNNECRTGANNLNTQFISDNDLTTVETATLGSVYKKLADCVGTKGLSDRDTALVLAAETETGMALLNRAVTVLDRHALLPELRAERSNSTQNKDCFSASYTQLTVK